MPSKERFHFEQYTEHNRVKHEILSKYLKVYLKILAGFVDAFHYIDGFAGRGVYAGGVAGSPLIAAALLADTARPAAMSLVESSEANFASLEEERKKAPSSEVEFIEQRLLPGELHDHLQEILSHSIYQRFRRVGTFAFIDPCGVKEIRRDDITAVMSKKFGECLLFWNYDGLQRWLGAARSSHGTNRLQAVFGTNAAVQEALKIIESSRNTKEKEHGLRNLFIRSISRDSNAKFILPFRFEAKDSVRTSHYLIHCSQHPRAFKVMKEIMQSSSSDASNPSEFQFLGRADDGEQLSMFLPAADEQAQSEILAVLLNGPKRVSVFTGEWVERPQDFLTSKDYKRILLGLEARGAIVVIDPKIGEVKPPQSRIRSGKTTLGDNLLI